ncbi:MAG: transporter substrate-binding domain-containing protein [Hyphomicrobiales bacterium]|nr:transporter substrate-binding domain-containing protein [Hyphomicrobiales bacterium]
MSIVRDFFRRIAACAAAAPCLAPGLQASEFSLFSLYWSPYVTIEKHDRIGGVGVALSERILKDAGLDAQVTFQPWARSYKMAQLGKNVLVIGLSRTPAREALFNWISPLFVAPPPTLVFERSRRLPAPKTIAEMQQYRFCATPGTLAYDRLLALGFELDRNLFEYQVVLPGKRLGADLTFIDERCQFIATQWKAMEARLRRLGVAHPDERYGFYRAPESAFEGGLDSWLVASKDFDPKALAALMDHAHRLKQSGELQMICKHQFGFDDKTCRTLQP